MSALAEINAYQEARAALLEARKRLREELTELQRRTEALIPLQHHVRATSRNFRVASEKLSQALHADASGILGAPDNGLLDDERRDQTQGSESTQET